MQSENSLILTFRLVIISHLYQIEPRIHHMPISASDNIRTHDVALKGRQITNTQWTFIVIPHLSSMPNHFLQTLKHFHTSIIIKAKELSLEVFFYLFSWIFFNFFWNYHVSNEDIAKVLFLQFTQKTLKDNISAWQRSYHISMDNKYHIHMPG